MAGWPDNLWGDEAAAQREPAALGEAASKDQTTALYEPATQDHPMMLEDARRYDRSEAISSL
jgi:hypothetical protein